MRHWGIVVTACYAVVVVFLLVPGAVVLAGGNYTDALQALFGRDEFMDAGWVIWLIVALIVALQALLLFVSVDTRFRHARPRAHVSLSVVTIGLATALLCFSIFICLSLALDFDEVVNGDWFWIAAPAGLWCAWAAIFFAYRHELSNRLERAIDWLLTGSVLQLLIAVPCHLIVRHRNECSAPVATGFGIATGIALMLMAFGPSVYFLYRKKLGEYPSAGDHVPIASRRPWTIVTTTMTLTGLILLLLLPYDDTATHRAVIDNAAGRVEEITAAVDRYAMEHGLRVQNPSGSMQVMYCDEGVVANFRTFELRDSGRVRLTVLTYSEPFLLRRDYTEFGDSIRDLTMRFGDAEFEYFDTRPWQHRLRSHLYEGPLFGRGCDWRARHLNRAANMD